MKKLSFFMLCFLFGISGYAQEPNVDYNNNQHPLPECYCNQECTYTEDLNGLGLDGLEECAAFNCERALSAFCVSSASSGAYPPQNIVDGNPNTAWRSASASLSNQIHREQVIFDLGAVRQLEAIDLYYLQEYTCDAFDPSTRLYYENTVSGEVELLETFVHSSELYTRRYVDCETFYAQYLILVFNVCPDGVSKVKFHDIKFYGPTLGGNSCVTCGPINNFSHDSPTSSSVNLSLDATGDFNSYSIEYCPSNFNCEITGPCVTINDIDPSELDYTLNGLSSSTWYVATATLNCDMGETATSVPTCFQTAACQIYSFGVLPFDLPTTNSANLYLNASEAGLPFSMTYCMVTDGICDDTGLSDCNTITGVTTTAPLLIPLPGLEEDTEYFAEVMVECGGGILTETDCFETLACNPGPDCPTSLDPPTIDDSCLANSNDCYTKLQWSPVPDAQNYSILVDPPLETDFPDCNPSQITSNNTNFMLMGLEPGVTYTITITANCDCLSSDESASFTYTPPIEAACDVADLLNANGLPPDNPANCDLGPAAPADPASIQPGANIYGTLNDMIGVNGFTDWDQFDACDLDNPFAGMVSHVRIFHFMEKDYSDNVNCDPDLDDCNAANINGGAQYFPATAGPSTGGNPDAGCGIFGNRNRYRSYMDDLPDDVEIHLTLSISPMNDSGYDGGHTFPGAWWTESEWGCNPCDAFENAEIYADAFLDTYCDTDGCEIDVLEIGNEPWGYENPDDYKVILAAFIKAFRDRFGDDASTWPIRLMPASFQAGHADNEECANGGNPHDFIGDRLDCSMLEFLGGINLHPYAFDDMGDLSLNPESSESEFLSLLDAIAWFQQHMDDSQEVTVTEYGWDSETVGDLTQGIYLLRAMLMMSRFNVSQATIYNSTDDPNLPGLFGTSGLVTAAGCDGFEPKQSFDVIQEMQELIGNCQVVEVLSEEENGLYAYLLADTNEDGIIPCDFKLVVWNGSATNDGNAYATTGAELDLNGTGLIYVPTPSFPKWIDGEPSSYTTTPPKPSDGVLHFKIARTPAVINLRCSGGGTLCDSGCPEFKKQEDDPLYFRTNGSGEMTDVGCDYDLFPQPLREGGSLQVAFGYEQNSDEVRYTLINTNGQIVKSGNLTQQQEIDIPNLPVGVYFLRMQSDACFFKPQKVVVH